MKTQIKKVLTVALILGIGTSVGAATYYQDRFIPSGVCMVEFNKMQINAAMIKDITIGPRAWQKNMGMWDGWVDQPPYQSLRLTLVNRDYYEIKEGDLHQAQRDFLKQIQDKCNSR
jgi:hypothetical protein